MTNLYKIGTCLNGEVEVFVSKEDKNKLKTSYSLEGIKKYYLDCRPNSTTKNQLFDSVPDNENAQIVNKNNFRLIYTQSEVVLNKKSWHYEIHKLMYGKYANEPRNFCKYFWNTIIFGTIFCLIFFPICIPTMIIRKTIVKDKHSKIPTSAYETGLFSPYTVGCIVINLILFMMFSMIYMWFLSFGNATAIHAFGTIGWLIFIIFVLGHQIDRLKKARRNRKNKTMISLEKKLNIIIAGLKSWYKKYCPVIEWKEN